MKIGLSLGGGGAKGAYQVGVLKALEEFNLLESIKMISGVSIGALNAYFYLGSGKVQSVYDAWQYGINNNPFKDKLLPWDKEKRGFYSFDIVRKMADKYSSLEVFKNNGKEFYVVLTKVNEPQLRYLLRKSLREKTVVYLNDKENPLEYVISSAAIPIVFGFHKIDDDYYIDGGFSDNNPIDVLIDNGAKIIFHSGFVKNIDLSEYNNKDVTLIELTSMQAMPALRLSRFITSAQFDLELFDKRVNYGYFVTKSMIEYLIQNNFMKCMNGQYIFSKKDNEFKNISIPEEIHEAVKQMYKEK